MKKIFFILALFVGITGFFAVTGQLFAQQTGTPLAQVFGKNLSVTSGTPVIAIKPLSTSEITETTAKIDFEITALKNTPLTILIELVDNQGQMIRNQIVDATNILSQGQKRSFNTPIFANLIPGTTYTFELSESIGPAKYPKVSFTTLGTSPAETTEPVSVQKTSLRTDFPTTVNNKPNPEFILVPTTVRDTYDVNVSGIITTDLNMRVGLQLFLGDSPASLTLRSTAFPQRLIQKATPTEFSYRINFLSAGTTYYYQLKDPRTGYTTGVFSFKTPGTPPPAQVMFDPNNTTGALLDYEFPDNIGEPTGSGSLEPVQDPGSLVPCGKSTDTGDDANCSLYHFVTLVQNVMSFLLILMIPITALVCIYTGVQMIINRKIPEELTKYKENFKRIGIGVAVMLLAYTLVATLLQTFVPTDTLKFFTLLDILG